jgi:hypothetical protein
VQLNSFVFTPESAETYFDRGRESGADPLIFFWAAQDETGGGSDCFFVFMATEFRSLGPVKDTRGRIVPLPDARQEDDDVTTAHQLPTGTARRVPGERKLAMTLAGQEADADDRVLKPRAVAFELGVSQVASNAFSTPSSTRSRPR